jgi:hypothetical protein
VPSRPRKVRPDLHPASALIRLIVFGGTSSQRNGGDFFPDEIDQLDDVG